jgi:rRNA-processing protein FCF1
MIPGLFGIDVIEKISEACDFKYELCILDKTQKELKGIIEKQAGKNKTAAKIALKFIDQQRVSIVDTKDEILYVDDLLLKYGKGKIVATNDIKLIKKLKEKNIDVLRLRQKKRVVIEE